MWVIKLVEDDLSTYNKMFICIWIKKLRMSNAKNMSKNITTQGFLVHLLNSFSPNILIYDITFFVFAILLTSEDKKRDNTTINKAYHKSCTQFFRQKTSKLTPFWNPKLLRKLICESKNYTLFRGKIRP